MVLDYSTDESPSWRTAPQRWLCHTDQDSAFAYARGRDFFRCSDHELWAYLSNDSWLLSARSGERIAHQRSNVYYDPETDRPIFYEPSEFALPNPRTGSEVRCGSPSVEQQPRIAPERRKTRNR